MTDVNGPAALVARAVERTAKGTPRGVRRKLGREEALAATRVVTGMLGRHGLRPTVVLTRDGTATSPGATYPLYLTRAEASGDVPLPRDRRLARGIATHHASVVAIARAARSAGVDVSEDALMGELAAAVPEYLEQFREEPRDPWQLLSEDLDAMGRWFASPLRQLDVAGYLRGMSDGGYAYGHADDSAHDWLRCVRDPPPAPDWTRIVRATSPAHAETASAIVVPVRSRLVAAGSVDVEVVDAICRMVDPAWQVGAQPFDVVQHVSVGLRLSPDRARVTTGFHVSYRPSVACGVPVPGDGARLLAPRRGWATFRYDPTGFAPDFLTRFERQATGDAIPWTEWLACDADTCATLLGEQRLGEGLDDALARSRHPSVLPSKVCMDDGTSSDLVRDRLLGSMHEEGRYSIPDLLMAMSFPRVRSWEEFEARTAEGERGRRLAFRQRMRA